MNQPIVPSCGKLGRYGGTALAVLLACATFFPFPIKAQEKPPAEVTTRDVEPTFKLQSERNMVTVRVVVRDKKGETVDNLRKENFQLFDRGKKQTIVQFSVEKQAPPQPPPPEPGAAAKTPPVYIPPRRYVGLYFDDVSTGFSGLARTRDAASRFLQTSLHPGDRVGVFTASGQKSLDFTDDLAKVRQVLADLHENPIIAPDETCGAFTPYEAYLIIDLQDAGVSELKSEEMQTCSGLPTRPSAAQIRLEALRAKGAAETRALMTLRGIESLARLMTTLPGQRSMVIISDGFLSQTLGYALTQVVERALHANIVINALDSRGLYITDAITDASQARPAQSDGVNQMALKQRLMREEARQQAAGMGTLAQGTGGTLIENTNDLESGFRRVAAAPDTYYSLAFSPENLKHDGAFHPLKVTLVSAQGISLQARKGYYAPKKNEDVAAQEKEDLQDAVFAQNEMQPLPIEVKTQFFMIDQTNAEIDVVTHVDLRPLRFRKEADRNVDNLTFVTAVFDRDGHFLSGQQKVLELRLRDQSLEKLRHTGIKVETEIKVKPGIYLIRTVVRDTESGQMSALNRTVEIPY
jgi:VWFA-related protein